MSTLKVTLRYPLRDFVLDLDLCLSGKAVYAIVGKSGSGKTTLLQAIAGFIPEATGNIQAGNDVWLDSDRGVFVPPHLR